jgi:hypothetical protein
MSKDPKFETNSNDQNMQDSKQPSLGSGVLDFLELIYLSLSLFGFRYSDFGFFGSWFSLGKISHFVRDDTWLM